MEELKTKLTDDSIMPFGKHQGKQLKEVPDEYLMWLWHENKADPIRSDLMLYIQDSFNAKDLK
jgi:uncharacterized protein (DUF3820 family)